MESPGVAKPTGFELNLAIKADVNAHFGIYRFGTQKSRSSGIRDALMRLETQTN